MKIAVLGSTGLLGQALLKFFNKKKCNVLGLARKNADVNIDITNDKELLDFFENNNFDIIINTVAIVNHKFCEDNPGLAYQINSHPASVISEYTKIKGNYFIQISTDGYYSGDKNLKHKESDNIKLLNEYARTKYAGEMFALTDPNALVVRTNIVGFRGTPSQPTFVEWVINSIKNNDEMTLFDDYFTSSISVSQFSEALYSLVLKKPSGIFNLAGNHVSSKADFIQNLAKEFDLELKNPKIGSVESLVSSKRADSLGLDVSKAESLLGYNLPDLKSVIKQLKKDYYEL